MSYFRRWFRLPDDDGGLLGEPQDKGFLTDNDGGCLLLGDEGMGGLLLT